MPSICSCRKPEPSTSWIVATRLCPPLCVAPSRGLLRHACQVDAHRVYSAPTDRSTGIICDQTISLDGFYTRQLPRTSAAHPLQGPRVRQDAGLHHQQLLASGRHHLRALQKPRRWNSSSSGSSSIFGSSSYGTSENATQIWIAVSAHRQEAPRPGRLALHFVTDPLGDPLREKFLRETRCNASQITNQLNLFDF